MSAPNPIRPVHNLSTPAGRPSAPELLEVPQPARLGSRAARLRELLFGKELFFLMEAHNGLSAKIAAEAGFPALWGSGLAISASLGVRDNNEASWTQLLEVLEFMTDSSPVPILFDGDTGFGNFNNIRRLVRKLEQRNVGGVCIEDKVFPKTNSFLEGKRDALADIDEFCGRIRAGKDAQQDPDFCLVARVEALVAGWGLDEALRRATAYRDAGADAILIHSKKANPDEVLAFKKQWDDKTPVIIVPTKYYTTPTDVFRKAGFRAVIWANHLVRSSITSMQETARRIRQEESLLSTEGRISSLAEVFRLQGAEELQEAERRYLPPDSHVPFGALILAASQGRELGDLTRDRPKAMVPIGGKPLLQRQVDALNESGVLDVTVVRGYRKEAIALPNLRTLDNDEYDSTSEVYSLSLGLAPADGPLLVSYGDVLFQKYIPLQLMEASGDFCIAVDPDWTASRNKGRYADYVACSAPYRKDDWNRDVRLFAMASDLAEARIHGEWIGLLRASGAGVSFLKESLPKWFPGPKLRSARMADLFQRLVEAGKDVKVVYTRGHWFDVDDLRDVVDAQEFGGLPP